jgi:hypothetical protein
MSLFVEGLSVTDTQISDRQRKRVRYQPMGLREFANTGKGKAVVVVLLLVGAIALYLSIRSNFSSAAADSANRVFIDADTGKVFKHTIKLGESLPVESPDSGKRTGYEAEQCYWTKDGKPKDEPTYVLLNIYKGSRDPTFCPDCGRLVVPHNPPPTTGSKPPPTKAEYASRHSARDSQ